MTDPEIEAFTRSYNPARSHDCDDQFRCVAEGRVEESAEALSNVRREVLGGAAHPTGQRDNGESGHNENEESTCMYHKVQHERHRYEEE